MKESLTCNLCQKTWKRDKSRGRKPTVCPKCSKSLVAQVKPKAKRNAKFIAAVDTSTTKDSPQEIVVKSSNVSIVDVYREMYPKPANYHEFYESTKNGSKWSCKGCGGHVEVSVPLVVPPTHYCPPKSNKIKEYERDLSA